MNTVACLKTPQSVGREDPLGVWSPDIHGWWSRAKPQSANVYTRDV
jgi:hypothetical protein